MSNKPSIIESFVEWKGFEREIKQISEIVIHGTGGSGTLNFVKNGGRRSEYERGIGLFHFLNALDGNIYQILPLEQWCYHSSSGLHDKVTIGIENEKKSPNNSNDLTEEQYGNLNALVDWLKSEHNIQSIVTHDHNRAKFSHLPPKPCVGHINPSKLSFQLEDK